MKSNSSDKKLYVFSGMVKSFDDVLSYSWKGTTRASSVDEARRNLSYQFKKHANLAVGAAITLCGKIVPVL